MDINLTAIILVSILIGGGLIGSFRNMKEGFGPFNLKVYGLTLVIGITAILVLTDVSIDKLTAAFGILGAIAGYLFGLKQETK